MTVERVPGGRSVSGPVAGRLLLLGLLLVSGAVAGAFAAGCGSGEDEPTDEEEVAIVIKRFQSALAAGDATAVCRDLLAPSSLPDPSGGKGCERAFRVENGENVSQGGEVEIASISIEGDSATVSYTNGDGFTGLIREGGRWYVDLVR